MKDGGCADGRGGGATKDGGRPAAFAGVFRPTILVLVLSTGAAAQVPAGTVPVHGIYTNIEYGFRVSLPNGMQGVMNAPPAPNHGVRIDLGRGRAIEITAEFDAALLGSARAFIDAELSSEHGTNTRYSHSSLDKQPAEEARAMVGRECEILLVQRRDVAGGVFYRAYLITDGAHLAHDLRIFRGLLSGFHEQPLPP
jgi:hypothetical protein